MDDAPAPEGLAWEGLPADPATQRWLMEHLQAAVACLDAPIAAVTVRGVDDAEMARLGRRFGRGSACEGESTGGLGLPLVRRLVARHDGALRFSSRVGEGTTASVFLPDEAQDARERPARAPDARHGKVVALRSAAEDGGDEAGAETADGTIGSSGERRTA